MRITKRIAIVTILALVTACSGGGGSKVTPTSLNQIPTSSYAGKTTSVTVKMPASISASFLTGSKSNTRKPLFTDSNVKGVIAVQLCGQSGETPPANTEFACGNGSIFDIVYNPATFCPNYSANSTYSCTFQFPAALSTGSQFELDLYSQAPAGGGVNGVGGTIPRGSGSATFGTGTGAYTAYDCSNNGGCLLGAAISDPSISVAANGPGNAIVVNQVQGFIQNAGGFLGANNNVYIASAVGSGGSSAVIPNGTPIGSAAFDANGQTITGGTCIQNGGNEYANAYTPSAVQAPGTAAGNGFDQITANTVGGSYQHDNGGVLSPSSGSPPNAPSATQAGALGTANAAALQAIEEYNGGSNNLLGATDMPCLVGYSGGTKQLGPTGASNVVGPVGPINFPSDAFGMTYDPTSTQIPTHGQVGQAGSSQFPEDTGTGTSPYYAVITGAARNYVGYEFAGGTNCANNVTPSSGNCGVGNPGATVGTSFSHTLSVAGGSNAQNEFFVYLAVSPLWGEVGDFAIAPNCTPSNACTLPYASNDTNGQPGRFTQNPGDQVGATTAGTYVPIVNMQGSGSSAWVAALQEIKPTGGVYSASVPQGSPNVGNANGGCAGVITTSSTTSTGAPPPPASYSPTSQPLFGPQSETPLPATYIGGAEWQFFAPPATSPNLSCTVTFTDGFSSFKVIFTNTGVTNPIPTPSPIVTPSPTAPPYAGPTAPATPTI